jgi:hypothetical protein
MVMRCGLRSKAAGVKSRPFGDMAAIIQKNSQAPQYELPGKGEVDMGARKTTKAFERGLEGLEWWLPDQNTSEHWWCTLHVS